MRQAVDWIRLGFSLVALFIAIVALTVSITMYRQSRERHDKIHDELIRACEASYQYPSCLPDHD